MDTLCEDRELLLTAVTKKASTKSSKQDSDSEIASTPSDAQELENALAAALNQGNVSTRGENYESVKRKAAEEPNPEVGKSKKRREEDVETVDYIRKMDKVEKLAVEKLAEVVMKPVEKNPKSKMDVEKKSLVKKTKMSVDVTKKAPEKAKKKMTKVIPMSPVKKTKAAEKTKEQKTKVGANDVKAVMHPKMVKIEKLVIGKPTKVVNKPTEKNPKSKIDMDKNSPIKKTKIAVDVRKKAPEKAKEKMTKVIPKSAVNKTKAAERAKGKSIKMAPDSLVKKTKAAEKAKEKKSKVTSKSPTKKTKMVADVKKKAAEKAKEKKTVKIASKKNTNANIGKKTQGKKPKTVKSQN